MLFISFRNFTQCLLLSLILFGALNSVAANKDAVALPDVFARAWKDLRQALLARDAGAVEKYAALTEAQKKEYANTPNFGRYAAFMLDVFPELKLENVLKFQQTDREALLVLRVEQHKMPRIWAYRYELHGQQWKLHNGRSGGYKIKPIDNAQTIAKLLATEPKFDLFFRALSDAIARVIPDKFKTFDRGQRSDVTEKTCRQISKWQEEISSCWFEPLANGTAANLIIQTDCGGDYCDWEAFLYADNSDEPQQARVDELSADHQWGFNTEFAESSQAWGAETLYLSRTNRITGDKEKFADCFSPRLSPKGYWIVCRDRAANVLRVPVAGGTPELVVKSGLAADDVDWVTYAYIFPDPVRFEGHKMIYTVSLSGGVSKALEAQRDKLQAERYFEWVE